MSLEVAIKKRLGAFQLDVAFEEADGSGTLGLLGASGCGKSMALKCIAGIEKPDEGRIVLNGRVLFDSAAHVDVPVQERRVGYLFQSYALFPSMTVEQNIAAGVRGGTREERAARVAEQVRAFRLDGLERHRPAQLSGGQQQRVALARIMANDPELLMLDEPFSALDEFLRWQLELELADTLRAFPGGVLFVTHNRDEVYRLCDRVCVLSAGKSGRAVSTSELFAEPQTLAECVISGCKNVSAAAPAGPTSLACADWGVTLDCGRDVAGCDHAGIRAHYLRVVECGYDKRSCSVCHTNPDMTNGTGAFVISNRIPCTVDRVIDNVFSTIVMCGTPGGGQLRVEMEKDAWAALGDPAQVVLAVDSADVMPLKG